MRHPLPFALPCAGWLLAALLLGPMQVQADVGSCLKAALSAAKPEDLKRAAAFATQHPQCLQNLVPPTTVPYVALSGSLDAANQSGALNAVGLGFGNSYGQCVTQLDPGKTTLKQLAPVLKPVCGALNMNCQQLDGAAADQVNAQLTEQVPLLGLMPCACAAATSGLGVERIAELVKNARQCGATLGEVAAVMGNSAQGVYKTAEKVAETLGESVELAEQLGGAVLNAAGGAVCTVGKLIGTCKDAPPPTAYSVSVALCKAHGGLKAVTSKTQQVNDFSLQCHDGLQCQVQPGQALQCKQGLSDAQLTAKTAVLEATNETWCRQRGGALKKGYDLRCRDGQCKLATLLVAAAYADDCSKTNTFFMRDASRAESAYVEERYVDRFEALIVDAVRRDPKATPAERLGTYACRTFLGRSDQFLCPDAKGFEACKALVGSGGVAQCRMPNGEVHPKATLQLLGRLAGAVVQPPASAAAPPAARAEEPAAPPALRRFNPQLAPSAPPAPAASAASAPPPVLRLGGRPPKLP